MVAPSPKLSGGVIDFARMVCTNLPAHVCTMAQVGRDDSGWPLPARILRDAWALMRTIGRERPHLIQLNPSLDRAIVRDAISMVVARAMHRGPIVVFVHGWDASWERRIGASRVTKRLFRTVYGAADRIYVLSKKYRDRLMDWGIDGKRVRTTSTMVDARQFSGLSRRRAPAPAPDGFQLLFMSRLVPDKGAIETLQAFTSVAASKPGLRLVCAGEGPEKAALQRLVTASKLDDRVSFPGFVRGTEKAQLLLDSDLFVFPTRLDEGCPVSLLEAMAAGLPIITTDAGGIGDVFTDGANGVLLGPRPSSERLANAIEELMGDAAALARIGSHNARQAQALYDARTRCRALEEDYLALLADRRISTAQPSPG
jgi:glycosyltransferase involved in cell wall biosynthesis